MELLTPYSAGDVTRRSALLLLLVGLGGCTATFRSEQADAGERVDVDTFLHEHLQRQSMVTVAEAYRAMVILADGDDSYTNFDDRASSLEQRGIARKSWSLTRDACIDRGAVAYMACRVMQLKGGVNRIVFGELGLGERRYAVRELVYRDMLRPAPDYQYLTGGELVDLMAKCDRYMAEHGVYPQAAVDIGDELRGKGAAESAQPKGIQ